MSAIRNSIKLAVSGFAAAATYIAIAANDADAQNLPQPLKQTKSGETYTPPGNTIPTPIPQVPSGGGGQGGQGGNGGQGGQGGQGGLGGQGGQGGQGFGGQGGQGGQGFGGNATGGDARATGGSAISGSRSGARATGGQNTGSNNVNIDNGSYQPPMGNVASGTIIAIGDCKEGAWVNLSVPYAGIGAGYTWNEKTCMGIKTQLEIFEKAMNRQGGADLVVAGAALRRISGYDPEFGGALENAVLIAAACPALPGQKGASAAYFAISFEKAAQLCGRLIIVPAEPLIKIVKEYVKVPVQAPASSGACQSVTNNAAVVHNHFECPGKAAPAPKQ